MIGGRALRNALDVTGKRFDPIDFTEAVLFFQVHRELPETVELEGWGLTWTGTRSGQDMYVAGISSIRLEGVTSGLLIVSLYEPDGKSFVDSLQLSKSWGEIRDIDEYEYLLGGVLDWPYGYCQLGLNATGKVTITFDESDGVSTGEYVLDPKKYMYKCKVKHT